MPSGFLAANGTTWPLGSFASIAPSFASTISRTNRRRSRCRVGMNVAHRELTVCALKFQFNNWRGVSRKCSDIL